MSYQQRGEFASWRCDKHWADYDSEEFVSVEVTNKAVDEWLAREFPLLFGDTDA